MQTAVLLVVLLAAATTQGMQQVYYTSRVLAGGELYQVICIKYLKKRKKPSDVTRR